MVNKVLLIGNVGTIQEVKTVSNGMKMARFSLATSENWKDENGNRKEKTEWHRIVVFGTLAGVVESYVKKGSKLFIEGVIRTRKQTDSNLGTEKYVTEIVLSRASDTLKMLDSKGSSVVDSYQPVNTESESTTSQESSSSSYSSVDEDQTNYEKMDDDIPF